MPSNWWMELRMQNVLFHKNWRHFLLPVADLGCSSSESVVTDMKLHSSSSAFRRSFATKPLPRLFECELIDCRYFAFRRLAFFSFVPFLLSSLPF